MRSLPFTARPAVTDGAVYLRASAYDPDDGTHLWGDLAEASAMGPDRATDVYARRPVAKPATTGDALYLSHQAKGVLKFA
ncbi:MAG: hypothetical protein ACI9YT_001523 [Halobacteriales archaeon]